MEFVIFSFFKYLVGMIRLSGIDKSFFQAELENHLMTVAACYIFHDNLPAADVKVSLQQMIDQYPRFSKRVTPPTLLKQRFWEDYDFNLDEHITEVKVSNSDTPATEEDKDQDNESLRELLGDLMGTPFDYSKALWHTHVIHYRSNRTAVFTRVHHSITDGQGAVRCLLSITKNSHDAEMQYGKHLNTDVNQTKISFKQQFIKMLFTLFYFIYGLFIGLWHVFDVLILFNRKHFTKELTKEKVVCFVNDVNLDEVKEIKNRYNVTVNDVLVSALTGAFREYILKSEGKLKDKDLLTYIPVSMRKPNDWELGNKVSIVWAEFPLDIEDPVQRLKEIHNRMQKIKMSTEPLLAYYSTELLGNSPLSDHKLTKWAIRKILQKPHAVFTNVPGPRSKLTFAGKEIVSFFPFLPQPGDGGFGIALLSYENQIACSLLTDKSLLPDGGKGIPKLFTSQVQKLLEL